MEDSLMVLGALLSNRSVFHEIISHINFDIKYIQLIGVSKQTIKLLAVQFV